MEGQLWPWRSSVTRKEEKQNCQKTVAEATRNQQTDSLLKAGFNGGQSCKKKQANKKKNWRKCEMRSLLNLLNQSTELTGHWRPLELYYEGCKPNSSSEEDNDLDFQNDFALQAATFFLTNFSMGNFVILFPYLTSIHIQKSQLCSSFVIKQLLHLKDLLIATSTHLQHIYTLIDCLVLLNFFFFL